MARILVTGAGGFVGRALCPALAARGHTVIAGLRGAPASHASPGKGVEPRLLGDIVAGRNWPRALIGCDVVVHLAQRAHRRADSRVLAAEAAAAADLARAAVRAGARRFLYLSSIKAMGETTMPGRPFRAGDPPRPQDPYGRGKLASERALAAAAGETGIEFAVVRSPLVYGPGAAGNFRVLARLAGSRLPLPFAAVDNRRSLVFVDNLADLMATAAVHRDAAGRVFLAADGGDWSTPALIRLLARGQGRTPLLFALPMACFAPLRALPGLGAALSRLTLSLQVDDSDTRLRLGWSPPVAAEAALLATARALAAR